VTIHLQRLVELGAVRLEGGAYWLDLRLLERIAGRHGDQRQGPDLDLVQVGQPSTG
jgi:hypothetical protein